jgi:large conductance mechanosensitive channel protein
VSGLECFDFIRPEARGTAVGFGNLFGWLGGGTAPVIVGWMATTVGLGAIIGGAFGKIAASMVEDIVNPVIGLALGRADLASLFAALDGKTYASLAEAKKAGAAVLAYGNFVNAVVQFLVIAFCIFIVVKQINRWTRIEGANLPQ